MPLSLCLAVLILFQSVLPRQLMAQELAIQTTELMLELQRYETQLEDYEFEYGFLDPRLLEPLLSIESLYQSLVTTSRSSRFRIVACRLLGLLSV